MKKIIKKILKEEGDFDWAKDISEVHYLYHHIFDHFGKPFIDEEIDDIFYEQDWDAIWPEMGSEEKDMAYQVIATGLIDTLISIYEEGGGDEEFDYDKLDMFREGLNTEFKKYIAKIY